MSRRLTRSAFGRIGIVSTAALAAGAPAAAAAAGPTPKVHQVAIHVDQNDAAVMTLALNNLVNVSNYYGDKAAEVTIELVCYGPGLHMLRADDSPVRARLTSIKQSIPDVTFSACNVTKTAMEKAEGHPIAIVPEARLTDSGAIRLIELQESGYSYLKP